MDDGTSTQAAATGGRRGDRATYLEQLSARILRAAERALKDKPGSLSQVSSLVGEVILELRRAEEDCGRLERQLEALQLRHRDLLDRVPIPCFITDEQGVVTDANREALLLLHSSERHMVGKPAALWFKDRGAAEQLLKELRAATRPLHRQLDVAPRDRRPASMTLIVQQADGVAPPLWRWFLLPDARSQR
jgi:PAS domain-containing protein